MRYLAVILSLGLWVVSAWGGEQRYVSDQLFLNLRSSPAGDARIINRLKSDDPVELLDVEGDFAKVRTAKGKIGFVARSYLTATPPKTQQITVLQQQIDELKKQLTESQAAAELLTANNSSQEDLQQDLLTTKTALDELQQKYDQLQSESKQLLQLIKERDQLKQKNSTLANEVETLQQENSTLLNKSLIRWFLAGAGVLFFGWFMGKISRKNKRRPY